MAFLALWPQRRLPTGTTDAPYGPALVCCAITTPANGQRRHTTLRRPTTLAYSHCVGVQRCLTMAFLALWPQRGPPTGTTDAPYGPALVCCAITTPANGQRRHTTLPRPTTLAYSHCVGVQMRLTMAFLTLWPQRGLPTGTTDASFDSSKLCMALQLPANAYQRPLSLWRTTMPD